MNENINLYEILKDCPKNTKLWSPVYGYVWLKEIIDRKLTNTPIILTSPGFNEIRLYNNGKYYDIQESECIVFPSETQRDWSKFKIPVKRFDPKTFQPFDKILALNENFGRWRADLFAYFHKPDEDDEEEYIDLIGSACNKCIPYNDETKHLLGTTEDCPEYYKWWED